jgi:hypothetical protein
MVIRHIEDDEIILVSQHSMTQKTLMKQGKQGSCQLKDDGQKKRFSFLDNACRLFQKYISPSHYPLSLLEDYEYSRQRLSGIVLAQKEPIDQSIYTTLTHPNKIAIRIDPEHLLEHSYFVAIPAKLDPQTQETLYDDATQ